MKLEEQCKEILIQDTGLAQELDATLRTKFVPKCGERYTTNVYNRILVEDCENITPEEKKEMSDGLIDKGETSAGIICALNPNCPKAKLLSYRFRRIECNNRLWEVDLQWTFVCE